MSQTHLAGLEAALARLPADVSAKLIANPGSVQRCFLYPASINPETGLSNEGGPAPGRPWLGYGDSPKTVAEAIDKARLWMETETAEIAGGSRACDCDHAPGRLCVCKKARAAA